MEKYFLMPLTANGLNFDKFNSKELREEHKVATWNSRTITEFA
jgi:hypothetical protein